MCGTSRHRQGNIRIDKSGSLRLSLDANIGGRLGLAESPHVAYSNTAAEAMRCGLSDHLSVLHHP